MARVIQSASQTARREHPVHGATHAHQQNHRNQLGEGSRTPLWKVIVQREGNGEWLELEEVQAVRGGARGGA
jgi:ferric iron reductase protein FhuF